MRTKIGERVLKLVYKLDEIRVHGGQVDKWVVKVVFRAVDVVNEEEQGGEELQVVGLAVASPRRTRDTRGV